MPAEVDAMQCNRSVTELVTRARNDDQQAWNALVKRYAPLIWSICRRYRLTGADAGDVGSGTPRCTRLSPTCLPAASC